MELPNVTKSMIEVFEVLPCRFTVFVMETLLFKRANARRLNPEPRVRQSTTDTPSFPNRDAALTDSELPRWTQPVTLNSSAATWNFCKLVPVPTETELPHRMKERMERPEPTQTKFAMDAAEPKRANERTDIDEAQIPTLSTMESLVREPKAA
jgi:hypothetical protein